MLVLTRKTDEKIIIDDNIEIVVVGVENGRVKLGINAPETIDIVRGELYSEIEAENKEAVNETVVDLNMLAKINRNDQE